MTYRNAEARLPETFLTLADANAFARWSFFCGVFVGAAVLGLVLSIAAVLT